MQLLDQEIVHQGVGNIKSSTLENIPILHYKVSVAPRLVAQYRNIYFPEIWTCFIVLFQFLEPIHLNAHGLQQENLVAQSICRLILNLGLVFEYKSVLLKKPNPLCMPWV